MTLGKKTIDNSVNYIPQGEQTRERERERERERDIKPNMIKNDSLPKKQNKKTVTKKLKIR